MERLTVDRDLSDRIVVNERTGTVVMGKNVHIAPVAIMQGEPDGGGSDHHAGFAARAAFERHHPGRPAGEPQRPRKALHATWC